jgi:hypothetical protein
MPNQSLQAIWEAVNHEPCATAMPKEKIVKRTRCWPTGLGVSRAQPRGMTGRWSRCGLARARDEKDCREWPSRLAATAVPSARSASLPQSEGDVPLPEGVVENVALAGFGLFQDMEPAGSAELAPSSAGPRPSRAFSLVKTRRFAMRVLSLLGKALG